MTSNILPQVERLHNTLQERLAAGSPFTTPRGAYAGYEDCGQIGPWSIGLAYSSFTRVLALTARNTAACLQAQPLSLATRRGRGQYDVTYTADDLQRWACQQGLVSEAAPVVTTPAPVLALVTEPAEVQPAHQVTVWDLCQQAITTPGFALRANERRQIWTGGGKVVSLWRRPSDGSVVLTAKNGAPGAVTSRPIAINPGGTGWKLVSGAADNYRTWQQAVSASLRQAA
jgi:hypothetical protein